MHIWLVIFMLSFFFYDMIILFGGIALNALQKLRLLCKVLGGAKYIYRCVRNFRFGKLNSPITLPSEGNWQHKTVQAILIYYHGEASGSSEPELLQLLISAEYSAGSRSLSIWEIKAILKPEQMISRSGGTNPKMVNGQYWSMINQSMMHDAWCIDDEWRQWTSDPPLLMNVLYDMAVFVSFLPPHSSWTPWRAIG